MQDETCSHLKTCPMFNQFSSETAGRIFKNIYCHGEWTNCERFKRSSAGKSVDDRLLPNGSLLAG